MSERTLECMFNAIGLLIDSHLAHAQLLRIVLLPRARRQEKRAQYPQSRSKHRLVHQGSGSKYADNDPPKLIGRDNVMQSMWGKHRKRAERAEIGKGQMTSWSRDRLPGLRSELHQPAEWYGHVMSGDRILRSTSRGRRE